MARLTTFIHDGIGPVLDVLAATAAEKVALTMEAGADRIQNYAQTNAPWSDRTGEARNGLTAEVYLDGGEVVLELYHQAEHGKWLELIQDGNFAIIMPTLEALGPEVLAEAGAAVMSIHQGY